MDTVERSLPGMGDFVEVGSPILAGVAGTVHVGMDTGLIALKIQRAIGQQVYLFSIILVVFAAVWLVNLAAKPLGALLGYAVGMASDGNDKKPADDNLLARDDEVGHLARLFLYVADRGQRSPENVE